VDELVVGLDVGGTNTRVRIAAMSAGGPLLPVTADVTQCVASAHELRSLVERAAHDAGRFGRVTDAVVAVAGPVTGDTIRITNWASDPIVSVADLEAAGLPHGRTRFVNDAVSGAWGALARLEGTGTGPIRPLLAGRGAETAPGAGNIVYVAPGTGLGEAVVVRSGPEPIRATVVAGEFQHTQMPRFADDSGLVADVIADAIGRSPDWEDLVSGRGLVHTYDALAAIATGAGLIVSDDDAMRAGMIAQAARAGSDPLALEASGIFYRNLARFAQVLAVVFLPCGAVVFGGATSEANLDVMRTSGMAEIFAEHHRFAKLLSAVPLYVVGGEVNLEGTVRLAALSG